VKNWWKTIGIEEKLDIISRLENVNKLLTYAVMLDSFMVPYVRFLMIELKKVLSIQIILSSSNLKLGVLIFVARHFYRNEPR
jgi:hypothetical protein